MDHLPECIYEPEHFDTEQNIVWGWKPCICDALRACEQRVLSLNPVGLGVLIAQRARERALDAAREAVESMVIAAIDALRQERSGNPDTPLSAENEDPPLVCGECGTEIALYDVGCLHLADNDDFGHIGTIAAIDALKEKP